MDAYLGLKFTLNLEAGAQVLQAGESQTRILSLFPFFYSVKICWVVVKKIKMENDDIAQDACLMHKKKGIKQNGDFSNDFQRDKGANREQELIYDKTAEGDH